MSLFLIVYERTAGSADVRAVFSDDQSAEAVRARFAAERELSGQVAETDIEVVVLSGSSLEELKRTHARYFASVQQLLSVPEDATAAGKQRPGA